MPKFIALISSEPGCDYSTAGCGKNWIELKSDTQSAALIELRNVIIGENGPDDDGGRGVYFRRDRRLSSVIMLCVSEKSVAPIEDWYKSADAELAEARNAQKEAEERQLFERLKAKFK